MDFTANQNLINVAQLSLLDGQILKVLTTNSTIFTWLSKVPNFGTTCNVDNFIKLMKEKSRK